jgi:choline dehydrogenase-like flavoprotein
LRGKALDDALRSQASRPLRLTSLLEQLPDPDNRVTLDPNDVDIYGVPLPRLAYNLGTYVASGLAAARHAHAEIFAALGATEIQHWDAAEGAGHIIGTATSVATIIRISSSSARLSYRRRPIPP